ncbi:MAG TPA: hypothetical protein VJ577_03385 [Burkholderiaceae bacterium]|nr:hypothetical protein [Burkholderiaceae bacterium]
MPASDPASNRFSPHDGRVASLYLQPLIEAAVARGVAVRDMACAAGLAPDALMPLSTSHFCLVTGSKAR